jgi:hypothetical protein
VRAVSLKPRDTVAVSAAAGGVGSIAVQLARRAGAKVIGIASPANHAWLSQNGVEAVAYGEGLADGLRKFGLNAFIDCHGGGYVNLAIELGVPKDRIDTIIDFAAAQQYGVKTEGSQEARNSGSWRSSPDWSPKSTLTCRSPRPSRSPRSAQRSGSSSRGIRGGRSFSRRDRFRGWPAVETRTTHESFGRSDERTGIADLVGLEPLAALLCLLEWKPGDAMTLQAAVQGAAAEIGDGVLQATKHIV